MAPLRGFPSFKVMPIMQLDTHEQRAVDEWALPKPEQPDALISLWLMSSNPEGHYREAV
jgi:hypothetical protein